MKLLLKDSCSPSPIQTAHRCSELWLLFTGVVAHSLQIQQGFCSKFSLSLWWICFIEAVRNTDVKASQELHQYLTTIASDVAYLMALLLKTLKSHTTKETL